MMRRGAWAAALCASLAALLSSRGARRCHIGPASAGWDTHPSYDELFDALVTNAPLWPGGPSLGGAPLLDVLRDPSGAVGALAVLDGRELAAGGAAAATAARLRGLMAPFVVRDWAPALALRNSSWMAPETRGDLRDEPGTAWRWEGRAFEFHEARAGANGSSPRGTTRSASTLREHRKGAGRSFTLPVPERAVDETLRAATSPAGDATRGLGTRTKSYRVVRTGAGAYAYNWHVDYAHNWIADLSGGDFRVVLTHPALADPCFEVERDEASTGWRQSACPRDAAGLAAWLRDRCGDGADDDLSWIPAAQHRFRDGDALFVPIFWLHTTERFTGAPFVTFGHFHAEELDAPGAPRPRIWYRRALGAVRRFFNEDAPGGSEPAVLYDCTSLS